MISLNILSFSHQLDFNYFNSFMVNIFPSASLNPCRKSQVMNKLKQTKRIDSSDKLSQTLSFIHLFNKHFSRGSSRPRDWIQVSCIPGRFFTIWATREGISPQLFGTEDQFHRRQFSHELGWFRWSDGKRPMKFPIATHLLLCSLDQYWS